MLDWIVHVYQNYQMHEEEAKATLLTEVILSQKLS